MVKWVMSVDSSGAIRRPHKGRRTMANSQPTTHSHHGSVDGDLGASWARPGRDGPGAMGRVANMAVEGEYDPA